MKQFQEKLKADNLQAYSGFLNKVGKKSSLKKTNISQKNNKQFIDSMKENENCSINYDINVKVSASGKDVNHSTRVNANFSDCDNASDSINIVNGKYTMREKTLSSSFSTNLKSQRKAKRKLVLESSSSDDDCFEKDRDKSIQEDQALPTTNSMSRMKKTELQILSTFPSKKHKSSHLQLSFKQKTKERIESLPRSELSERNKLSQQKSSIKHEIKERSQSSKRDLDLSFKKTNGNDHHRKYRRAAD